MIAMDKKLHIAAGLVIAVVVGLLFGAGVGLIAAAFAGWGKERWDKRQIAKAEARGEIAKHTVDKRDFWATVAGGLIGTAVVVAAGSLFLGTFPLV